MICLPANYQKYDLPLQQDAVRVFIEVHIKDIPKVRYNTVHKNATIWIKIRYILATSIIILLLYANAIGYDPVKGSPLRIKKLHYGM